MAALVPFHSAFLINKSPKGALLLGIINRGGCSHPPEEGHSELKNPRPAPRMTMVEVIFTQSLEKHFKVPTTASGGWLIWPILALQA